MADSSQPTLTRHLDCQGLASAVRSAIQETIFTSGLRIAPRRVGEIADALTQSLVSYYDQRDQQTAQAAGEALAVEGLSPQSLLAAAEALRSYCQGKSNPLTDLEEVVVSFVTSVTLGFISSRENRLLRQQEQTFQALVRAQGREQGSS